MESCISQFLDNCDADSDHKITLAEWGQCLGATSGKFFCKCFNSNINSIYLFAAEMEDKCAQFKALNEEPENN